MPEYEDYVIWKIFAILGIFIMYIFKVSFFMVSCKNFAGIYDNGMIACL